VAETNEGKEEEGIEEIFGLALEGTYITNSLHTDARSGIQRRLSAPYSMPPTAAAPL